jgi:hypothetical protein
LQRIPTLLSTALLLTLTGCRSNPDTQDSDPAPAKETGSDAQWEELEDDDSSGKDKDGSYYGDSGKSDSCGEEVVEGASCEGDWEETLCQDEQGSWWWCENGAWTSK